MSSEIEHGSIRANDAIARIVERKGKWSVKIILRDDTRVTAERRPNRQIVYDKPERVPYQMKKSIVPELFKRIDDLTMGTRRGSA